jgi:hypothetical protein
MSQFEMKSVLGHEYGIPLVPWAKSVCPEWADRDQFTLVLYAMALQNGEDPKALLQHLAVNDVHAGGFNQELRSLPDGPPITSEEFRARIERVPALDGDPVRVVFDGPFSVEHRLELEDAHGGHLRALLLRREGGAFKTLRDGRSQTRQNLMGFGLYWRQDADHNHFFRWLRVRGSAEADHVVAADGPFPAM